MSGASFETKASKMACEIATLNVLVISQDHLFDGDMFYQMQFVRYLETIVGVDSHTKPTTTTTLTKVQE